MLLMLGCLGATIVQPSWAAAAPPATTTCTGPLVGGTYNKIVVAAGQSCSLSGVTVKHDVVANGAKDLDLTDAKIGGSLLIDGSAGAYRTFHVCGGSFGGDIRVRNLVGLDQFELESIDESCNLVTIGGDVRLVNNPDYNEVVGAKIGGSASAVGNNGIEFTDNKIGGSLSLTDNSSVELHGNNIRGNRTCSGNTSVSVDEEPPPDVVAGRDTCHTTV
jgi:hypothetical protein